MYYYELLKPWSGWRDNIVHPAGYYCSSTPVGASVVPEVASRIWFEGDTFVTYVKDNLSWTREVDMKEFAWIKLKAKSLRDIL